jgi:N-acetyltransferase
VSKAYVFLLPHDKIAHRERIMGCVIAQRISIAMAIVPIPDSVDNPNSDTTSLVPIGPSGNFFCDPTLLPTPMGIPRLFVSSTHRRLGIARRLLTAAARTFIHGCPLDPEKGHVAFSQPTGSGQAVMDAWTKTEETESVQTIIA